MTGAEVAKIGIVPANSYSIWLNQRVGLFKDKIEHGSLFSYFLLTRPEYQKALRDKGSGAVLSLTLVPQILKVYPYIFPVYWY